MGEVVMISEGDEIVKDWEAAAMAVEEEGEVSGGRMVRWERLLPNVALRVLLVEADDSTRQVIGTLLRKCSFKVAAVPDGLQAWEVLKERPNSIDLILTEAELPSISGFALLTLIMEHEHCKNIPVIMMSSNDSVNMVYKCMLRGAADFLVKPVRKNELQNLWQHVWRRQSAACVGQGLLDESITQQKAEGLSDNDGAIDLSNGCMARTPQNEECNEKGNDAQSSCSVPDLEAESAYTETVQDTSQVKCNKLVTRDTEMHDNYSREVPVARKAVNEAEGLSQEAIKDASKPIQQEDPGGKKLIEASDNNDAYINTTREAIDLIGTFQNYHKKSNNSSTVANTSKFDSCPQLNLSLRRYDDCRSRQDSVMDEKRNALNQSNVSAFSRYRSGQPASEKQSCTPAQAGDFNSLNAQKSSVYLASSEFRQGNVSFSCPQPRMLPFQVPVKGVRFDPTCTSYGSSLHSLYYSQTGASPSTSPDSAGQSPSANTCNNQTVNRQAMATDTAEQNRHAASATESSPNGNLCNGALSHVNSFGGGSACGSNGSGNPAATSMVTGDMKVEGASTNDENTNRSLQREAALTKFRQKRKDRCFEKKVRYESRKKLAEQRPRVKGQFVRQVQADPSPALIDDA